MTAFLGYNTEHSRHCLCATSSNIQLGAIWRKEKNIQVVKVESLINAHIHYLSTRPLGDVTGDERRKCMTGLKEARLLSYKALGIVPFCFTYCSLSYV